jgi:hypothetical protein
MFIGYSVGAASGRLGHPHGNQTQLFKSMKRKIIIPALLICSALLLNHAFAGESHKKHATQAELLAQAKLTEAQAREIALTKVPKGTIQSGELEEEHHRLIWSFDISTPNTKDITEVAVDAKTGAVVSVDTEKPGDQKKEKDEDDEKGEKDEKK